MSGFDEPWQTSWAREADNVKALAENNAHLRAALVKAEEECATWRQRAEGVVEAARFARTACDLAPGSVDKRRWCMAHQEWTPCPMAELTSALAAYDQEGVSQS